MWISYYPALPRSLWTTMTGYEKSIGEEFGRLYQEYLPMSLRLSLQEVSAGP